jgi:hypothetical protein
VKKKKKYFKENEKVRRKIDNIRGRNKFKLKKYFLKNQYFFLAEKKRYLLCSISAQDTLLQSLVSMFLSSLFTHVSLRALGCPGVRRGCVCSGLGQLLK